MEWRGAEKRRGWSRDGDCLREFTVVEVHDRRDVEIGDVEMVCEIR